MNRLGGSRGTSGAYALAGAALAAGTWILGRSLVEFNAPSDRTRAQPSIVAAKKVHAEPVVDLNALHVGPATPPPPGEPMSLATRAVDVTSGILQTFRPIGAIREHVADILQHHGDSERQVVVHEYMTHLSEDFGQVLLFDKDTADARLIGVQFVISDTLYATLPREEQSLWSPMNYAVKSNIAVAPGLPSFTERQLKTRLSKSYAKSWLFWHIDDGDSVPAGRPTLMDMITAPSQVNAKLLQARNMAMSLAPDANAEWERDLLRGTLTTAEAQPAK